MGGLEACNFVQFSFREYLESSFTVLEKASVTSMERMDSKVPSIKCFSAEFQPMYQPCPHSWTFSIFMRFLGKGKLRHFEVQYSSDEVSY